MKDIRSLSSRIRHPLPWLVPVIVLGLYMALASDTARADCLDSDGARTDLAYIQQHSIYTAWEQDVPAQMDAYEKAASAIAYCIPSAPDDSTRARFQYSVARLLFSAGKAGTDGNQPDYLPRALSDLHKALDNINLALKHPSMPQDSGSLQNLIVAYLSTAQGDTFCTTHGGLDMSQPVAPAKHKFTCNDGQSTVFADNWTLPATPDPYKYHSHCYYEQNPQGNRWTVCHVQANVGGQHVNCYYPINGNGANPPEITANHCPATVIEQTGDDLGAVGQPR